jgi:hypothetical protein
MAEDRAGRSGAPDGDWELSRERKLTLGLEATPAERLAWLEEAILFAYRAGALPKPRPGAGDPHDH